MRFKGTIGLNPTYNGAIPSAWGNLVNLFVEVPNSMLSSEALNYHYFKTIALMVNQLLDGSIRSLSSVVVTLELPDEDP